MPVIIITTIINAPKQRCFDLARSIDFHEHTSLVTKEKAIAGVTSGLINKGETVTWKARHFGILQTLTSEITKMKIPDLFEDRMVKGAFQKIQHLHTFEEKGGQTIMTDRFEFESPFGLLGKLFNKIILTNYMKGFLLRRNEETRRTAECEDWKKYLDDLK